MTCETGAMMEVSNYVFLSILVFCITVPLHFVFLCFNFWVFCISCVFFVRVFVVCISKSKVSPNVLMCDSFLVLLAIFGNGQGWQALGCPLPPSENFLKETTWANNALRTEKIYEYGMRLLKKEG